jgi:hypothetical protein
MLLLLLAGVGVFLYHNFKMSIREAEARAETQRRMLQPRLISGQAHFQRRVFYSGEGLGNISQICVGWPADREGTDIAVVGNEGAHFVDSDGQIKRRVRFSIQQWCPIEVARTAPTGEYGYLTRDESWADPATLFDKEGRVSWRSSGTWSNVDDSAPGDVLGDGKLTVVIGFNGIGGLALLDGQGKRLWKKEEANVWHVETLDTNDDGRDEILHTNAKGQLLVRNENGDVIAHYLPGVYVSDFVITRWGEEAKPSHILIPISESHGGCCNPELVLLDSKGTKVREFQSPLGDLLTSMSATPVRFGKKHEYFAVLKNEFSVGRSMLTLYDKDGEIVYQEILGESCLGIAALPRKDGEWLLVGCAAKIWEYSQVPTSTSLKQNAPKAIEE